MIKKALFAGLLALTGTLQTAFAQTAGNTVPENATAAPKSPRKAEIFDNPVYFKIGISTPVGKFGQSPVAYRTISDSFNGKDGTGAKSGFDLEVGLISYLDDLPLNERFRLGINAALAGSLNEMSWEGLGGGYTIAEYDPFIFAGLKIGPALSYNLINKVIVDGFLQVNPVITSPGKFAYVEALGNRTNFLAAVADRTFSVRKSVGFNIRYSAFLLGLEYNFGKVKYKYIETGYTQVNNSASTFNPYTNVYNSKTPTSTLLLTTGIKF